MNLSPAAHALIDYARHEWEFARGLFSDPVSAGLFIAASLAFAGLFLGALLG